MYPDLIILFQLINLIYSESVVAFHCSMGKIGLAIKLCLNFRGPDFKNDDKIWMKLNGSKLNLMKCVFIKCLT